MGYPALLLPGGLSSGPSSGSPVERSPAGERSLPIVPIVYGTDGRLEDGLGSRLSAGQAKSQAPGAEALGMCTPRVTAPATA
jgi:hypothetical protein